MRRWLLSVKVVTATGPLVKSLAVLWHERKLRSRQLRVLTCCEHPICDMSMSSGGLLLRLLLAAASARPFRLPRCRLF